jgi:hypothetical protein
MARVELPLLDPQWHHKLGIIASDLVDEALGVLAADEDLDGIAQQVALEPGTGVLLVCSGLGDPCVSGESCPRGYERLRLSEVRSGAYEQDDLDGQESALERRLSAAGKT